jgi:hypothetical protein
MKRYIETHHSKLQALRDHYLPLNCSDLTTASEHAEDLLNGKMPYGWLEFADHEQLSALIIGFLTWIEQIAMLVSIHGFEYQVNTPDPFIDIVSQCDPGLVWLALRNAKGGREKPNGSISTNDFVKFAAKRPKIVALCISIHNYNQS